MRSPAGRNAQHCACAFEISLGDLDEINKKSAWSLLLSKWFSNLSLCLISHITELLYVKHCYMDLPKFSASEMDYFIEYPCDS